MFRLLFVGRGPCEPSAESEPYAGKEFAVGYANSLEEALSQARACDMLMVSAMLPEDRALEIVRAVAQAEPRVRILVKDLGESHQAPQAYIEAGATGWLL